MTPTQVSIQTGMTATQRVVRKLCKWLFFGLLLGLLPVISQAGVLWLQGSTSEAADVFGDGELFFLAIGLATAAVGDLVFDRRLNGHVDIAHGLAIAFALIIITLAAVGYGAAKTADSRASATAAAPAASPEVDALPKGIGSPPDEVRGPIGDAPASVPGHLGAVDTDRVGAPEGSTRAQPAVPTETAEDRRSRITNVSALVLLFAIVASVANVILSERW
ncbi:hypothetical protein [Micromonospora sp. NPDC023956]|uniref:hypothetical protein n=1 Tax=Micromonospora sp. NPDC023956 TaxID=3155722 RepID=UPI0033C661CD